MSDGDDDDSVGLNRVQQPEGKAPQYPSTEVLGYDGTALGKHKDGLNGVMDFVEEIVTQPFAAAFVNCAASFISSSAAGRN